jgi:hypothetical protein
VKNKVRVHNFSEPVTLKQYRHNSNKPPIVHPLHLFYYQLSVLCWCPSGGNILISTPLYFMYPCACTNAHNLSGQQSRVVLNKYSVWIWAWDFCGFLSLCRQMLGNWSSLLLLLKYGIYIYYMGKSNVQQLQIKREILPRDSTFMWWKGLEVPAKLRAVLSGI